MKEFLLQIKKQLDGHFVGDFLHPNTGAWLIFSDTKLYEAGDSRRHIHAKLSAKYDTLISKKFFADKAISIDILLDINYNWKGHHEQVYNSKATLQLLADILSYAKNYHCTVGAYYPERKMFWSHKLQHKMYNNSNHWQVPALLDLAFGLILHAPRRHTSQLTNFLNHQLTIQKKRAIVIISDFLTMTTEQHMLIAQLEKFNEVFLFRVGIDKQFGKNYILPDLPIFSQKEIG